jgi:hypothetical protein
LISCWNNRGESEAIIPKALRFYHLRGFLLAAIYRNAIAASRKLKPEIPLQGIDGIPIRDEIELELLLEGKDESN